jgi:alkylation response protein AidB-like acyl-CoA dehydrogenase
MTLLLNEEQRMLKSAARDFFRARLPVAALRRLRDDDDPDGFERAAWREMADLGWAGVLVPEAWGGSDFGYTGLGQVLEEAGRTLAATPLLSTALIVAPLLAACGSATQKEALLPALAAGERLGALALDEGPRHAPTSVAMRASRDGEHWVLDGAKHYVLDGHVADDLVVVARSAGAAGDEHGLSLFLVPASTAGLTRTRTRMVDSRNAARVVFDRVRLGADALLGAPDTAFPALDRALDGARAGLAAEMLGGTLEAFERTLDYLKLRRQFGVPIGSFQALKHRAAQMFCEIELTRSAVLAALTALDAGEDTAPLLASLAKARACETFELVSNEAVQMHGGIGMTDAADIGFFLKRARVAQQAFGDASFHRERYAQLRGF